MGPKRSSTWVFVLPATLRRSQPRSTMATWPAPSTPFGAILTALRVGRCPLASSGARAGAPRGLRGLIRFGPAVREGLDSRAIPQRLSELTGPRYLRSPFFRAIARSPVPIKDRDVRHRHLVGQRWSSAAVDSALVRGGLADWRGLLERVWRDPDGPLAQRVEARLDCAQAQVRRPPEEFEGGIDPVVHQLWRQYLRDARDPSRRRSGRGPAA